MAKGSGTGGTTPYVQGYWARVSSDYWEYSEPNKAIKANPIWLAEWRQGWADAERREMERERLNCE